MLASKTLYRFHPQKMLQCSVDRAWGECPPAEASPTLCSLDFGGKLRGSVFSSVSAPHQKPTNDHIASCKHTVGQSVLFCVAGLFGIGCKRSRGTLDEGTFSWLRGSSRLNEKRTSPLTACTCLSQLSVPEPEVTTEHQRSDKLFACRVYQRMSSKGFQQDSLLCEALSADAQNTKVLTRLSTTISR